MPELRKPVVSHFSSAARDGELVVLMVDTLGFVWEWNQGEVKWMPFASSVDAYREV